MSKEEIHRKMSEYSTFIDKVLRPELDKTKAASHKVKTEMPTYPRQSNVHAQKHALRLLHDIQQECISLPQTQTSRQ